MKRCFLILILLITFFFYYATNTYAGINAESVTVSEFQDQVYPEVYFTDCYIYAITKFDLNGFQVNMENPYFGTEISWGQSSDGYKSSALKIQIKTRELEQQYFNTRLFIGFNDVKWYNSDHIIPESNNFEMWDLNFGQELAFHLLEEERVTINIGAEWALSVLGALDFSDYAYDGSTFAYPRGSYSICGLAGAINLQLETKLTPDTTFFAMAGYEGSYYWHGNVFLLFLYCIDESSSDWDFEYDFESDQPSAWIGYRRFTIGLKHLF